MYNLAGYARNNADGTVGVRLQGDKDRIERALEAISAGNKESSKANIIGEAPAALDPNLKDVNDPQLDIGKPENVEPL